MTPGALLAVGLFGLAIGSFLNVCIARVPLGESIVSPRSRCLSCRAEIAWYDNIPIVSYLILSGHCRQCGGPIGLRYPLVELATAAAFVAQYWVEGALGLALAARLMFTAMLIVLFGTDLETGRLPNVVTISGTVVGFLFSLGLPPGIRDSFLGAALGGGMLWLVRWGWKQAKGVEGMGLGDVKMLAMIGAFLGWRQAMLVLFLASIGGAIVGIGLILVQGRAPQTRLPFGTFLAVSAYLASLAGDRILAWYLGPLA
jgi:leader peptidase (prepilin peptidase)/N-methyltransferase